MKKKILFILVTCFILCGCVQKAKPISENEKLKIVVTSDIHYFLKDYYQECEWFEESISYGDGKMVTYGDEILNAFEKAILEIQPDLLIVTGDLTFNGEKDGHIALANRLEKISQAGIEVAVIPGNHDIENIFTKGYGQDDYFEVENITGEEFREIYKNCGYQIASAKHKNSLSYVIPLNSDYTLLMMDSTHHKMTGGNSFNSGGKFSESTLNWMKKQLDLIKKEGKTPIVAMHHNLVDHNELLNSGYTIANNETVADIFKDYGVSFIFSGHIHCQNIQEINGIYDIASSSLMDAPLQYGIVELEKNKLSYHTESLKISVDAPEYFQMVSKNRMKENFEVIEDEILKQEAMDIMALVNYHYFAGTISSIKHQVLNSQGYQTIMEMEDDFIKKYMESMLKSDKNHTSLEIEF